MTALAAVLAAPSLSAAQTNCQQQRQDNQAAGTVLGAIGGALVGSAIAGRGNHTTGAVIGGVVGAVVGNSIASGSSPCPDGYYPVADPAYPAPDGYYDADGRYHYNSGPYAATPVRSLSDQEDALDRRIHAAADAGQLTRSQVDDASHNLQHIRDREADMRASHGGHLTDDDRLFLQQRIDELRQQLHLDVADAGPPPPAYPPAGDFWASAPTSLRERADWLEHRIHDDHDRQALTDRGVREALDSITSFRQEASSLRARDGGQLSATDRQYLNDRLDYLSRRIKWMETVHR
jgi:hypothetical protein